MRSSSASGGASCAPARSNTPVRGVPAEPSGTVPEKGTHKANGKASIKAASALRVARASPSGNQARATRRQGSSALSTFTAACLSSGCFEVGQNVGVVSAFTPASRVPVEACPPRYSPPQCMARKTCSGAISALACTGTTMVPRALVT